jgi:multidrug efflux system membrane fusion protein
MRDGAAPEEKLHMPSPTDGTLGSGYWLPRPAAILKFPEPALAGLLVLALALPGCKESNSAAKQAATAPPVPVVVAKVERRTVPLTVTGIGNVEPIESVAVKSRIDGEIVAVKVRDGQDVTRGQLLFELDPRTLQSQLKQLEANEAKDRALLANAQSLERRYADLLSKGFISEEAFSQAKTARAAAEATVDADQAAVETARVQLSYTRMHSTISGRAGRVMLQVGNVVKANDTQALVVINQVAPIYVSFAVPEQYLSEIRAYMAKGTLGVQASPQGAQGAGATGKLSFIDNAVDAQTGTIRLRGTFTNTQSELWPGQFVTVKLTLHDEPDTLVVPSQAVQNGPEGQYVFVIKSDMTAEVRRIDVGRQEGVYTVIGKGLEAGETVVTSGQLRVTPGAKVAPKVG